MNEPIWVSKQAVLALHDRSLALHGGAAGIRDEGLLDSALERPRNRWTYEHCDDVAALAAVYASGMSCNHPFTDGDKRAAFLCLSLFLRLNGERLAASQVEATRAIFDLAAGKIDVTTLTDWIRANLARP